MVGRCLLAAVLAAATVLSMDAAPVRTVLVLSGSNNHDWKATTPVIVSILEREGYRVQVEERVASLAPRAFGAADVVLSNFNTFGQNDPGPVWAPSVRAAFVRFIEQGGGFVGVHAGGSVFDDWPEFRQICGAWWGPATSHGAVHESEVTTVQTAHPLVAGLVPFRTTDEFWQGASLSPGAAVLAAVVPDPAHGGSGRPEPALVTTTRGRGRGVALLLGHDVQGMRNPGFEQLLARAVAWAAAAGRTRASHPER